MIRPAQKGAFMAEIAEITRTYGGQEGRRVKMGTRFAIAKPVGELPVITRQRFTQLVDAGLARAWDPANKTPAPVPAYTGGLQVVKLKASNESRTAKKQRAKNAGAPGEPRPLANPSAPGGLQPAVTLESLSPEAQASIKSNLGLRGRRGSSVSRSTMRSASPPGPESSMGATAPGGGTTAAPQDSKG
jgi:hypothetical protein